MKKFLKKILLVLAVVLLAAGCNQNQPLVNSQESVEQRQQIQVSYQVLGVDIGDQLFNFYVDENKTALDLLKSGHQVETKEFPGIGEFVESINGKKPEADEFWALYINGEQSQVGASSYFPKDGDKIEWKLEKIK